MVRPQILDLCIGVRVPASQPIHLEIYYIDRVFWGNEELE